MQPAAADLTVHHAYFESMVGIISNWIKAKIFPHCRKDFPLPLHINRGGFDVLEEEKIGSKVSQKTSLPPYPSCRFSSSFFLRHRKPTPSPFLPTAPPWATNTTKRCQDHRPATTASVISRRERLSLLCKTFLPSFSPPWPSATTIPTPNTSSTTGSQHNHQPATKQPPRLSPSAPSSLSLSSATFSSSSHSRRRPPPFQPPAAHRHPQPDHRHARLSTLSPLPLLLLLRCPCSLSEQWTIFIF